MFLSGRWRLSVYVTYIRRGAREGGPSPKDWKVQTVIR